MPDDVVEKALRALENPSSVISEEQSDLQADHSTANNHIYNQGQSVTSTDREAGEGMAGKLDADEPFGTGESSVSAGARRSSNLAGDGGHRHEGPVRIAVPSEGPAFPILAKLQSIRAGLVSLLSALVMPVSALFRKLLR